MRAIVIERHGHGLRSKLEIFVPLTEICDTLIGNKCYALVNLSEYITLIQPADPQRFRGVP